MTDSPAAYVLAGRHALVAGVGGPLARAAAVALAEGGATVSLLTQADARAQEVEAQSILNECWSLGHDGQVCRLDSTDAAALEAALDGLEAQLGPLSVLVTVPQPAHREPAADATRAGWDAEIARSATTTVVPVLSAGRRMLQRGQGRIVNVLMQPDDEAGTALYAAAQGAVLAFTRALAVEWQPRGVLVRSLAMDTMASEDGPHAYAALREALRQRIVSAALDEMDAARQVT